MYVTNTHLKPVIGIDIHFVNIPAPCPIPHPYIGLVIDPFDYIPFIGSTVSVNGVPRGNTDTMGKIITFIHIPLGAGFTMPPIIGHESQNFFGSKKVEVDGAPFSGAGYMLMTCNDIGLPLSLSPGKKFKPIPSLFLPTSFCIPLQWGPPVMVGGPMVPNFSLMALLKGFAMGGLMKGAGKLLKVGGKLIKKGLTAFNNKVLKNIKSPWSEKLSKKFCKMGFEPVDLISGRVTYEYTDFTLPGPIPIVWQRVWDSDSHTKGVLGFATHLCYDRHIQLFAEEEAVVILLADGRPVACPYLQPGETFYHPQENLTITRKQNGHFLLEAHEENLYYHFNYELSNSNGIYKLSLIEDYSGFRIQLHYNGKHLSAITDSVGRRLLCSQNQYGCITKVELVHKGEKETLISYGYNAEGDLIRIADALDQHTIIEYNGDHLMTRKTDRNGQAFYWEYDNKRRCIHTGGEGGILEGRISYHKGYNLVTNSLNETTSYYYDANNLCVQETDSYGNSKFTEYTEEGQLYRQIDEEGNSTGYIYDMAEHLKEIVQPDGTSTLYSHNDQHQLIMITYPDSTTQTYVYDENKRIEFINYPNGQFSVYSYNEDGLLHELNSKAGQKTFLEYDEDANLAKVVLPDESVSQWKYDAKGRCIVSTNTEGQSRRFTYDALDRVKAIQFPDGNNLQLEYNAYEEVVRAADKQSVVQFEYTPLGLLKKRKQNNTELSFYYDTEQRLIYLTNEVEKIYRFGYNNRGEITNEVGFDGLERFYQRDKAGKVIKTLRPGGRSSMYEYDANGRIIRTEYHDGSWEIFNYDKNGALIEATNQFATTRFSRNKLGLVEEETQDTYSVQSKYDEWGNRVGIESSLGAAIQQIRDKLGNVVSLQAKTDGLVWETQFKYNRAGQEIERLLPGNIISQWRYNGGGRPSEHVVKRGGELQRSKKYTWEVDDRLTNIFDAISNSNTAFRHDDFGNLVWAQYADNKIVHRSADETGNLYETTEKSDRKYGAGGRLLETKQDIYKYDEEGNLISKTNKHTHAKWKYDWYANGMLQKVTRPDYKEVTFKYDALRRRVEKCFEGLLTRWVWDGNVPLHEWQYLESQRPKPIVNEWGELSYDKEEPKENITTWVFDADSFRPAAKIKDGQTCSIVCDYLGTPQEMYDEGGTKVWEGVLDIYGRIITLKGEKSSLPFRYQGQYEDAETGLYYNRFRYYGAEEGVFITQDPIGLAGSNLTIYAYVKDINCWIDPSGLDCRKSYPNDFPSPRTKDKSAKFNSERNARDFAMKKIGGMKNAIQIAPGKLRSPDGRWQYRAKPGDLKGHGPSDTPHIHLERLNPDTGEVLENWHLRW